MKTIGKHITTQTKHLNKVPLGTVEPHYNIPPGSTEKKTEQHV